MEIFGFLIIVGILIVFIVRRDLWSGFSSGSKADEVEEASVKMRLQMEHTMNTLITQMDTRIHQIEGLVAAADERARMLEQQLAAVREEQARAQRKAEQEIAAMRAAQNSYYPPRETAYEADYGPARRTPWNDLADYRARGMQPRLSMQPVGEVSSVRRADYAARARFDRPERDDGFAEALSASMRATERNYGAVQGPRPAYYGDAAYKEHGYDDAYQRGMYSAETYAYADEWDKQEAAPRHEARTIRWPEAAPAEMVAEESPAVIVEPNMGARPELRIEEEEPEEEGPVFTPEQLEELAKTEAEVVVSSSVADVVDLPVNPEEEESSASYDGTESGEAGQAAAAGEESEATAVKDGPYLEPEAEEEETRQTEAADAKKDFAPSDETEMETAEGTAAVPAIETDEEDQEDLDDFEEESEARPESVYMDGENLTGVLGGEIGEKDAPGGGEQPPPVTTRPDSPAGRARALLEKGMSPVEVSKQTGMGRGAVDLLAQMVKRQRKSESVD